MARIKLQLPEQFIFKTEIHSLSNLFPKFGNYIFRK